MNVTPGEQEGFRRISNFSKLPFANLVLADCLSDYSTPIGELQFLDAPLFLPVILPEG
jgi:hypothetical protein